MSGVDSTVNTEGSRALQFRPLAVCWPIHWVLSRPCAIQLEGTWADESDGQAGFPFRCLQIDFRAD
jgi:hypothetical protein